jgi:hypothetical protein
MTAADLPSWSIGHVAYGPAVLREFSRLDVRMAVELSADPYIVLPNGLPPNASQQAARTG